MEALAHPIPFLIAFSTLVQMLLCGLISFEFLNQSGFVSCCIAGGPLLLGSPITAIGAIHYLYDPTDYSGMAGEDQIKSGILRNVCAGVLGIAAAVAVVFRWKELISPLLGCTPSESLADAEQRMNMMRMSSNEKKTREKTESDYDVPYGKNKEDSSRSVSTANTDNSRFSDISDITM